MTLAAGTRLGPYEILAPLGAGGMGEVYRARDTRLGREVAVKVLPAELSSDRERILRFEQEARAASALNHPNMVTVHDFADDGGVFYIAMELVDGKTLRELLIAGPLPIKRTLGIAAQVADGLSRAHASGIVHRDLKPENLMVRRDGLVKILDFGLTKLQAVSPEEGSQLPTRASPSTQSGIVLGTVGYMSPEQARGAAVDFRSDQFSLGSVVYEMATGNRAFQRESAAQTLAAIIEDEPEPIERANPRSPASLGWILQRCLAKDPEDRYGSTRDLARDFAHVRDQASEATGAAAGSAGRLVAPGGRRHRAQVAVVALLGVLAVAGAWLLYRTRPEPAASPLYLTLTLPSNAPIKMASLQPSLALAPDGSRLVYVAESGGSTQLFLRALNQPAPAPLAGTEGAISPFFSPDGQWVAFFAGGKLKKAPLAGGVPITLCQGDTGGSWGDDGTIVFESGAGLAAVSAAGGTPRVLATPDRKQGETYLNKPSILPGSKTVLFSAWKGGSMGQQAIFAAPLDGGARRVLSVKGACPRYAPSGHLVFVRDDESLMAAPFDLSRLEVTGSPVPVAERVLLHQPSGTAQYSISNSGCLVFLASDAALSEAKLVWVDRRGSVEALTDARHDFEMPRLSPDGRRVAVAFGGDLWIYEIGRGAFTRLTFHGGSGPVWTPDGRRVAFFSWSAGPINQFWVPADGSSPEERLLTSEHAQFPESFTPDGKYVAFMEIDPETQNDLWALPLEGERKPRPMVRTRMEERGAAFSPDGRWVAYSSDVSGSWQVYVQAADGTGGKMQVSTDGGSEAVWAPDGRELFYRNGNRMMAVSVGSGDSFVAGRPALLFEGRYAMGPVEGFTNYDVSRDGQRFLMIKGEPTSATTRLDVVLNWFEVLHRLARAAKRT